MNMSPGVSVKICMAATCKTSKKTKPLRVSHLLRLPSHRSFGHINMKIPWLDFLGDRNYQNQMPDIQSYQSYTCWVFRGYDFWLHSFFRFQSQTLSGEHRPLDVPGKHWPFWQLDFLVRKPESHHSISDSSSSGKKKQFAQMLNVWCIYLHLPLKTTQFCR